MRCCARLLMFCIPFLGICLFPMLVRATEALPTDPRSASLPMWQAVALGVIEGATEYLPVSSTGHLKIFQHWIGQSADVGETEAADALAICIQSGAILAVVLLYFGRLKQMLSGLLGADRDGLRLFFHLIVAFAPAVVVGLLFGKTIKQHLFFIRPITIALIVGALLILATPRTKIGDTVPGEKDLPDMKWWDALVVGVLQCLGFWPGFSRSLATILGCRTVGLKMSASVEFSFLLGLLTLTAATAKEGLDHGAKIVEYYGVVSPIIALVVAFVSAVISVKFMVGLLGRYGLAPFGYYRLVLAGLCFAMW